MSQTVYPSFLTTSLAHLEQIGRVNDNVRLRVGIVQKIIYPTDKESITKQFIEYDVLILEQNIHGGIAPVLYKNLLAAESFGGIGDFSFYTYRPQQKIKNPKKTLDISPYDQDGAIVLVLFVDGLSNKGVIIGALGHPDRKVPHEKDKHELLFVFNGISFHIKDNGSLEAKFIGKTDHTGKPVNKDLGETVLIIDEQGGIKIAHKNAELIIAKDGSFTVKNKNITQFESEKNITFNTKENLAINAEKNISQKSKKDLILEASGNSSLKAQQIKITGGSKIELGAPNIEIKGGGQVTIKAGQITLNGMVQLGGAGGTPAVTSQTQFLGFVLNIPVFSQAIGPFSSSVFIK